MFGHFPPLIGHMLLVNPMGVQKTPRVAVRVYLGGKDIKQQTLHSIQINI